MRNNRLFQLIAITALYCSGAQATEQQALPTQLSVKIPSEFSVDELSPRVAAGEPILFVDLTCMLCNSLVHSIQGKYDDLKVVFVRAIPPVEKTTNQMLWHLSDTARFGKLSDGCEVNCSTIGGIGAEPSEMQFTSDSINYRQRLISIGINSAMHRVAFKDGEIAKVPALYINNEMHVIHDEEELTRELGEF